VSQYRTPIDYGEESGETTNRNGERENSDRSRQLRSRQTLRRNRCPDWTCHSHSVLLARETVYNKTPLAPSGLHFRSPKPLPIATLPVQMLRRGSHLPKNQPILTPGQAAYVLSRLFDEGKVSHRDIRRLTEAMDQEIRDLESRLVALRRSKADRGSDPATRATQRRSPQFVASRRIQGEYMGLIRHLRPRDRARMKKLAAERGREAAIKEMRDKVVR
jgi:hypothetical protein